MVDKPLQPYSINLEIAVFSGLGYLRQDAIASTVMVSPPNPNQSGSSAKQALEAGLAALKARDYDRAIALLESVTQTAANGPSGIRAQMGLVAAYKATGNLKKAIALCSSLAKSPNSQVKTWADRALTELTPPRPPKPPENKPKSAETPPETGFVAFDAGPKSPKKTIGGDRPTADKKTGFLPLEPTAAPGNAKSQPISPLPPPPTDQTSEPENSTETAPETAEISGENSSGSPTDIPGVASPDTYQLTWREAGRAKSPRPLKPLKLLEFRLQAVASAIALFFLARFILQFLLTNTNSLLVQLYIFTRLPIFAPIQLFYRDPTPFVQMVFGLLLASSPWLIDALLKLFCGIETLRGSVLSKHSKEASRVLRSFCTKQNMPVPVLKLLPLNVPVAFSYGCLPRFARIAVSRGLLEQLTDDEIATIFARELGHISHWDFAPMSLAMLVIQIPYLIYWQVAHWQERLCDLMTIEFLRSAVKLVAAAISATSYGIYKLLRWPMLWVSRRRVYFSDRTAAEITGNPNGLTRALGKIAIGIAGNIEQQKQTSFFLESFDLLLPVGVGQAVSLGSAALHAPLEQILLWDVSNRERNWLTVNSAHPLLGERLKLLALYAQFWKLETELDLANAGVPEQPRKGKLSLLKSILEFKDSKLFLQGAPFFGIPMSLAIVGLLWLIGGIFSRTSFWQLDWLWGDRSIIWGCLPIGFSIGTLMRINYFFPDITPRETASPSLPEILSNPESLPLDAEPVRLSGQLLGRSGMSNWLGQDLILQTATGLVRLHYVSRFGYIGSLWPFLFKETTRPSDLIGTSVVATGWLRRGATVAIDLESLRSQGGRVSDSGHPIWSAILAFAAAFWGAYIIIQGPR
ncbi:MULTISPECIES: zinc metalloprotease HtpX [unclassified Microcoleus]|uniref:zinc metalloprotease HtpX n=1 Tax=unclassified Microcoleus TaxID=2642155 RepID=UPI002FD035B1